jgi:hypothetical protein
MFLLHVIWGKEEWQARDMGAPSHAIPLRAVSLVYSGSGL